MFFPRTQFNQEIFNEIITINSFGHIGNQFSAFWAFHQQANCEYFYFTDSIGNILSSALKIIRHVIFGRQLCVVLWKKTKQRRRRHWRVPGQRTPGPKVTFVSGSLITITQIGRTASATARPRLRPLAQLQPSSGSGSLQRSMRVLFLAQHNRAYSKPIESKRGR